MIHHSPFADVRIPDLALPDLVLASAPARGDKPALVDGTTGAAISYARLVSEVERTAAGLHARGFARGEVAALVTGNRVEFAIAFLAMARLGGITTTLNPGYTEREMAQQLADARPALAFTSPDLEDRVRTAGGPALRDVYTFGEEFGGLGNDGDRPPIPVDPERDVVALPYSSGTTGTAKGVMLTHRNLVATLCQMQPVEATGMDDVTIGVLPFFHIYGLAVVMLLALYRGATLVVLPRFEMESFLGAIERYRVTRLPLVPPLILRLAQEPRLDDFDLSSVKVVTSGAAPLPPEPAVVLGRRLGCLVKQGYGMTELSPGGHMHPEDRGQPPPGSVGMLFPNTELRLVDPASGVDVAPGETGEIWYRGPQVMKGYVGRPAETAAIITAEGWLKTGDIGRTDDEGYLYVVDRLKEIIKCMGFQVAPAELEALLLTHPAVADAAVIACQDAEAGEVPKAFVVCSSGAALTEAELIEFVAGRVAHYKRLRAVEVVDQIPRSPSGKILRRILMCASARARQAARAPARLDRAHTLSRLTCSAETSTRSRSGTFSATARWP